MAEKKHIVVFFMSTFQRNKDGYYNEALNKYEGVETPCQHTNETALRYLFASEQGKIDGVYAFVSESVSSYCNENGSKNNKGTFSDLKKFFEVCRKEEYVEDNDGSSEGQPVAIIEQESLKKIPENGFFREIDVADDLGVEDAFLAASNMFDKINEDFLAVDGAENVTVHVDFTGGLRNAAMVMLAMVQMLKFSKAEIGKVTYVNFQHKKVQEASELLGMFSMISGAQEFYSFGSVKKIIDYFSKKDTKSEQFSELLNCIRGFSDQLKSCCKYEKMTEAVSDLKAKINTYEQYVMDEANETELNKNYREKFFSKLLPTIREQYKGILNDDGKNKLPLIRWALQKGYWQQAIIWTTEWIPKYLMEDTKVIKIRDKNEEAKIIDICKGNKVGSNKEKSNNNTKKITDICNGNNNSSNEENSRNNDWIIWQNRFFCRYKYSCKLKYKYKSLTNKELLDKLLDDERKKSSDIPKAEKERSKEFELMLHNNVIEINQGVDIKKIYKIIDCYSDIVQNWRNESAHANVEVSLQTAKDKVEKILNILDGMKLEGKHNEQKN